MEHTGVGANIQEMQDGGKVFQASTAAFLHLKKWNCHYGKATFIQTEIPSRNPVTKSR